MADRRALLALGAILAVLSLASLAGAEEPRLHGSLATEEPIDLTGQLALQGAGGAHLEEMRPDDTVSIEAETITVETEWLRGTTTGVEDPETAKVTVTTDQGNETTNLTNARLTIDTWTSETEILVAPDSQATIEASGLGGSPLEAVPAGSLLAEAFYSEESTGPSDIQGYTYRTQTPLGSVGSLDSVELRGDGEVFANNARLEAVTDEGEWRDWTGLRVTDRTGPKEDFEVRIIVLHLQNARISMEAEHSLTALAGDPSIVLQGSMVTTSTSGTVSIPTGRLTLEDERTEFTGEGRVNASVLGPEGGFEKAGLRTSIEGGFEMTSAEPAPNSGSPPGAPYSSGLFALLAVPILLVAVLLVGLHRASPWLAALPSSLRGRLYDRYQVRAAEHEAAGRSRAAAESYETMAALRPDHPTGWYAAAANRIEAGDPGRAVSLVSRARHHLNHPPLDLIELEVAAAAERGDTEVARQALIDLAEASPRKAQTLVEELGLDVSQPAAVETGDGWEGGWPSA